MKTQTLAPVAMHAFATGAAGKLSQHNGWAALYGVEIDRLFYKMELERGCFSESLDDPESVLILNQHKSDQPIGKALKFDDREKGLWMDFGVNTETQVGKECISNLEHGILTGLSVGFDVVKVETEKRGEGAGSYETDIVKKAKLAECSLVSFPAIPNARIENGALAKGGAVTFSIIGDENREHLSTGDRVQLATYARIGASAPRVRPERQTEYPQLRRALQAILNDE